MHQPRQGHRRVGVRKKPRGIVRLLVLGAVLGLLGAGLFVNHAGKSPRQWAAYLDRRAEGHAEWMVAATHWLTDALMQLDRGEAVLFASLPAWAGASTSHETPPPQGRMRSVQTIEDLRQVLADAEPGDVITLMPGRYLFRGKNLEVARSGLADAPIVVRAAKLGEVTLLMDSQEGFLVSAPHWRFENLRLQGVCAQHADCDHAFHIVGRARGTVIRNVQIEDYNAHIKINGLNGAFPDGGHIEHVTLTNNSVRATALSVTPIDLVAASDWLIEGSLIADFAKGEGNQVSYGAFAKGGGRRNRFEGNLVVCEYHLKDLPGQRVGLSLGGGGTGEAFCRNGCKNEQDQSILANNLIVACSDVGVYLNRAFDSKLLHNTILDTAGVEAVYPQSTTIARNNLLDGVFAVREGAFLLDEDNQVTALPLSFIGLHPVRELFQNLAEFDFRWQEQPARVEFVDEVPKDLCRHPRNRLTYVGAVEDFSRCLR